MAAGKWQPKYYILHPLFYFTLKKMRSFWLLLFVIKMYSHTNISKTTFLFGNN